jgi:hypothetical protein
MLYASLLTHLTEAPHLSENIPENTHENFANILDRTFCNIPENDVIKIGEHAGNVVEHF